MSAFRCSPGRQTREIRNGILGAQRARVSLHRWLWICFLVGGCGNHVVGLDSPGIEIAPGSAFTPTLVVIERYLHLEPSEFGQYQQYDVSMVDDTGAEFQASTEIHWNYGAPEVGQTYPAVALPSSFKEQAPTIEGLFTRPALYHLVNGTVTYTRLGHDAGELVSVVFDIEYEGGRRFKGRVAEPLKVMVSGP
jgi:hypothetical protein